MYNLAQVFLWGKRIGFIELQANNCVAFEYDQEFLESNIEISPILMPLSNKVYAFPELLNTSFNGVPGLVYDSLPDRYGNAIINAWLTKQGRDIASFNVIEKLCYIGTRGMGALEYVPSTSENYNENIQIDELVKLADDVLNQRKEIYINAKDDNAINQLFQISSSAGGARAKALIAWNKNKNIIKSGQINAGKDFDYYLIKFDGIDGNGDHNLKDSKQYTSIEYVYYLMAIDAGINMNECELFVENNRRHFITKRFDRCNGEKLHMQSYAALCHLDYSLPRNSSYEHLALTCRKLSIVQTQIEELYTRMVFNELAKNYDDHVKNFSFLMDKSGKWSLSPAYDITYSYNPTNYWLKEHQMLINGKSKSISYDDLIETGKNMKLSKIKCTNIINKVIQVLHNWDNYADKVGINSDIKKQIKLELEQNIDNITKNM